MDAAPNKDHWLALARAQLAQARANLCSHGLKPSNCREAHDHDQRDAQEAK